MTKGAYGAKSLGTVELKQYAGNTLTYVNEPSANTSHVHLAVCVFHRWSIFEMSRCCRSCRTISKIRGTCSTSSPWSAVSLTSSSPKSTWVYTHLCLPQRHTTRNKYENEEKENA